MSHGKDHDSAQHTDVDLTGIADNDVLAYNASLTQLEPTPPTGNSEIAYAENISGTGQTIAGTTGATGTAVDITSCSISVPANSRPVWIEAKFAGVQTVTGDGQATILIVETTSGSTIIETDTRLLPNDTASRHATAAGYIRVRIGPTVATRTFKLQARCDSKSGNTPSFSVNNTSTQRSFIHAWAE